MNNIFLSIRYFSMVILVHIYPLTYVSTPLSVMNQIKIQIAECLTCAMPFDMPMNSHFCTFSLGFVSKRNFVYRKHLRPTSIQEVIMHLMKFSYVMSKKTDMRLMSERNAFNNFEIELWTQKNLQSLLLWASDWIYKT